MDGPVRFEEARSAVLEASSPLGSSEAPLLEALGRILASDLVARADAPPLDLAAADGYALSSALTEGASALEPRRLALEGDIRPGQDPSGEADARTCAAVQTGSPLPASCDAVLAEGEARREGDALLVDRPVLRGANDLARGSYFREHDRVVPAGVTVYPEEINIAAGMGRATLDVVHRPRVAVVVTGSELADVGGAEGPGKIWGSNLYHLMARVAQAGAEPVSGGVVRDDPAALRPALESALDCHAVVTTGGTSGGRDDRVKEVLSAMGASFLFTETRFRPGRTFAFALHGRTPVFCLPGSPRSLVTLFHLFVRPALLRMMGRPDAGDEEVAAILEQDLLTQPGTMKFILSHLRRTVTGYAVRPLRELARGGFISSENVNALTVVPEDVAFLTSRFEVSVLPLHDI